MLVLTSALIVSPSSTATTNQLPPPVAGKTVNATLRSGKVRYRLPGSSTFVALTAPRQVPLGTTFDTTAGRVTLITGASERAWFYEGTFTVEQSGGDRPITTLTLAGTTPSCGIARAAAKRKRKDRHLWGDGKGRFRTAGLFSSATVRGTRWVVTDRCDGTLTRVVRGVVSVRDFAKHKTVLVHAGEQDLAKKP
jgi:hypothetical protein